MSALDTTVEDFLLVANRVVEGSVFDIAPVASVRGTDVVRNAELSLATGIPNPIVLIVLLSRSVSLF
jgi:hypothetical protein